MRKQCRNEVEQLHMFFQDWFTGAVEDTDDNFARVAGVLADDFFLMSPRGERFDRAGILALVREHHARRRPDAFRLWVDDVAVRLVEGPLCLATYREHQDIEGETTCRFSSALFRACPDAPNRVEWVHLQETWVTE